ncbi:hypothetical protein [Micromonospora qiuiae]|nr:hypothetical protein [Micromonospora qiuiae]
MDAASAAHDRAWARANQARGLAAKEYLDDRATPSGHPAAAKESHERHRTAADHSRWRRLALATPAVSRLAGSPACAAPGRGVSRPHSRRSASLAAATKSGRQ